MVPVRLRLDLDLLCTLLPFLCVPMVLLVWGYRSGYWTGDDAYYILKERLAKGEITREQFEQMSRDLQEPERI